MWGGIPMPPGLDVGKGLPTYFGQWDMSRSAHACITAM
jgi:hypothetical protein